MQYLQSSEEARAFDRWTIDTVGVPSLLLMENAGSGATRYLCDVAAAHLGRVAIVGGPGRNGGDAWVVARHLLERGVCPDVFVVGDPAAIKGDARTQFDLLSKIGLETKQFESFELTFQPDSYSLLVDGMFGTGLSRPLEGVFAEAVLWMNACAERVFSLDVPSGICATRGAVLGDEAVRAQWTATFGAAKRGLWQNPGASHAGIVRVIPLGAPPASRPFSNARVFDEDEARMYLPTLRSRPDFHKGHGGHVAIVGGAESMVGATCLAGRAALRAGAGKVTILCRAAWRYSEPELMVEQLREGWIETLRSKGVNSLLVGPGLGRDAEALALTREVLQNWDGSLTLDADALTAIATASSASLLESTNASVVITPHPGEAARLLTSDTREVQRDRFAAVSALVELGLDAAILKGAYSLVAVCDEYVDAARARFLISSSDVPALSVPGSGDVLVGVLAALRAQRPRRDEVWLCAALAARWHSLAGLRVSAIGALAGEVADALPAVLNSVDLA